MFPKHINKEVFDDFQVPLTQKHIDEGVRNNCQDCPVASAFQQAFIDRCNEIGDEVDVTVDGEALSLAIGGQSFSEETVDIPLSGLLQEYINDFDNGLHVPAGTLYIEVLDNDKLDFFFDEPPQDKSQKYYEAGIEFPDDEYSWRRTPNLTPNL